MARRRRKVRLGQPVGIRRLREGGYPKHITGGGSRAFDLTDGGGKVIARGFQVGCTKIRPGAPGHWVDSKRCTYNFKFPDAGKGKWYACRGYGEGVAVSCRRMKGQPRSVRGTGSEFDLRGARRR